MVGAGMASCLPGALLRDLGADVLRIESSPASTLDAGIEFARVWNRDKTVETVEEDAAASVVTTVARDADILVLAGPEARIEANGLTYHELARASSRLVVARIRPSFDARGPVPDFELLVAARRGVPTQINSHHGGPAFPDLQVANAGAALGATAGAL